MTCIATLFSINEDVSIATDAITKELSASIGNGDLTSLLKRISATSSFWAYSFDSPQGNEELGSGAIAGIVIGSTFLAIMALFTIMAVKRRRKPNQKTNEEAESIESADIVPTVSASSRPKYDVPPITTDVEQKDALDASMLALVDHSDETTPAVVSSPDRSVESSSVVSSTGWSSSAGIHSLTSNDLGITIDNSDHSSPMDDSELNFPTPQLLEELINSGDWAGVMQASARFDAGAVVNDDRSDSSFSTAGSTMTSTTDDGGEQTLILPSDIASGPSENSAKVKTIEEIRQEVETLVRRVIPSESGNVDEMLYQFRGREEELVETLRRMQERQIAKKARIVSHMDAKLRVSSSSRYNWKESFGVQRDDIYRVREERPNEPDNDETLYQGANVPSELLVNQDENITHVDNALDDHPVQTDDRMNSSVGANKEPGHDTVESGDDIAVVVDRPITLIVGTNDEDLPHIQSDTYVTVGEPDDPDLLTEDADYIGNASFDIAPDFSGSTDTNDFHDAQDDEQAIVQAQKWLQIGAKGASDAADWAIARCMEDDLSLKDKSPESASDHGSIDSSKDDKSL